MSTPEQTLADRLPWRARPPLMTKAGVTKPGTTKAGKPPRGKARGTPLWVRCVGWGALLATLGCVAGAGWLEMRTSGFESVLLARFGRDLRYAVYPGPTTDARYPVTGPYDARLGYVHLPRYLERLAAGPYRVLSQARMSPTMLDYIDLGFYPPYREKTTAGLQLLDQGGLPLYGARYPERVYTDYAQVPPLIARTLVFIENRLLLDPTWPNRNPAVDWDRFGLALMQMPLQMAGLGGQRMGGSTLATQIEKYRHSPGGQTSSPMEKLRQMGSASVRAYLQGADTTQVRYRILVDYLNSTPLSARTGVGEVNGLGDGLWAWYGTDFATANRILEETPRTEDELALQAVVYKEALSLLLAQRRPSYYLSANHAALEQLCDAHLRALEAAGVIPAALGDAARNFRLRFRPDTPAPPEVSFVEQKAVNAIRNRLLSMLGVRSLYDLDRLDLTAETTLNQPVQRKVTALLQSLADRATDQRLGLVGPRLLNDADPAKVVYSFTLLERTAHANLVRLQVDTLDKPMDLNEGARLDLGSTAKLRTLITYLEIIQKLYEEDHGLDRAALLRQADQADDVLSRWVAATLAQTGDTGLRPLLEAAMNRTYSGSTAERFFTGGGVHVFGNFEKSEDFEVMTVGDAFRRSVNLVFIRLMRDVVNYYIARSPTPKEAVLDDPDNPARQTYLSQFADHEGSTFLNHFWDEYGRLGPDEALDRLADKVAARGSTARAGVAERLAIVFRSVRPEAGPGELGVFLNRHLPAAADAAPGHGGRGHRGAVPPVADLYAKADPQLYSLNDRGYLVGIHPLELWLVGYLQDPVDAANARARMLRASAQSRQDSYQWLFSTRHKHAQDQRIGIVMEEQAFARIHADWKRLGYPFETLVPSYATAIGSSGDRPDALAELMGIIVNGGVRLPTVRVSRLDFASGTPYEASVGLDDRLQGERVLSPDIAAVIRPHLIDVTENGTAVRARGALRNADGSPMVIGGKTGTGDQRFDRFGPGGVLLDSRVVNRTATFVFFIGDRYFGVITAHVHGEQGANYVFTSALPAQLLKTMGPILEPMVRADGGAGAQVGGSFR